MKDGREGDVCSGGEVSSGRGDSLSQASSEGMGPGRGHLVCVRVRWEAWDEQVGLGFR